RLDGPQGCDSQWAVPTTQAPPPRGDDSRRLSRMTGTVNDGRNLRRILLVLFPLFFLTYAYGRQTPANANAVSRIALALAILDEGKLSIDRYEAATCDKAIINGHYYSDKAPGLSFASLPALAVGYTALRATGKADLGVDQASGEPT